MPIYIYIYIHTYVLCYNAYNNMRGAMAWSEGKSGVGMLMLGFQALFWLLVVVIVVLCVYAGYVFVLFALLCCFLFCLLMLGFQTFLLLIIAYSLLRVYVC